MYCAYVTRIRNLRKHTNADRLLCGECFGNTKNDLLRRKDENGAPAGGYLDPEKRNIKALKLRGEKSDGLFLPLSCLASFTDIKKLQEGDTISVLNGITICEKYVPAVKRASGSGGVAIMFVSVLILSPRSSKNTLTRSSWPTTSPHSMLGIW